MQIVVTFDSMEEFARYFRGTGPAAPDAKTLPENSKTEEPKAKEAAEAPAPAPVEETLPESSTQPEAPPESSAEAVTYALADVQKAVREVVRKKGKEVAKAVLARYPSKDKPGETASGAGAVRPEDYASVIAALKEAVDG